MKGKRFTYFWLNLFLNRNSARTFYSNLSIYFVHPKAPVWQADTDTPPKLAMLGPEIGVVLQLEVIIPS